MRDLWAEWWTGDIWIASWDKALAGISAEQALWSPKDGAHCIWQLMRHVVFWRRVTLARLIGENGPSSEEVAEEQFSCPATPDPAAWEALKDELLETHKAILDVLGDPSRSDERARYHLAHDAYHLGQIMYVRKMLGFGVVTPP
jgi:hypothetical protein